VRSCDGDNQSEVGQSQNASSNELTPLLHSRPQLKESSHASDDEQKMAYAPNHHHRGIWLARVPRAHKRPKLYRPRLEEMSHEQIEAIPGRRYEDANAEPPRAVSSCEYKDGYINQRLEQMQMAKLLNKDGRKRQG
jgi:hypothetical protein